MTSAVKAFRRNYLLRLQLFDAMDCFLATLMRLGGARVMEVLVNHRPGLKG